ncbi:MotE family protein [Halalkalibacter alkaliphilus]|uniref:Magnesium transporter MgtE intracellular domain-containing protein n=1 Tax=Halalkalibacter alkaliphilus TaxID=2917993 RepID=A0A9X1ZVU8_9BACI|nr:hypothetical protein [Halalkalibacter alkaliphilus]MCL7746469.1 hypothetical protein [Halalkalibacter alkaliphilus]
MREKDRSYSKFQWFFLVICIPVLFAVILFIVILSFLGVDVVDKTKQAAADVPFLSSMVQEEEEIVEVDVSMLDQRINEQEAEIVRLQQIIDQREEAIEQLENELRQLEEKNEIDVELQNEAKQDLKDIARIYESMSTKNAAAIVSELSVEEALLHLSLVSVDARAGILSKVESELAAELMSRFVNE